MKFIRTGDSRRPYIVWVFCLLVISANAGWVWQNLNTLVEAREPVQQVSYHLRVSHKLHESLLEAESSLRGHLMTGDPEYLKHYHGALHALQRARDDAAVMVADNPVQAARLAELNEAIESRLAELAEKASLYVQGRHEAVLTMVRDAHGRELMEKVRKLVEEYRKGERAALEKHFVRQADAIHLAYLTFAISTAVSVLLVLLVAWLIRRASRSNMQAEAALHSRNTALAKALDAAALRSAHSHALSELGRFLQSSRDMAEAMALLDHYLPQVFAAPAGALYLTGASRNQLRLACQWGEVPNDATIEPDDCWGLRRGQPYTQPDNASPTRCTHLHDGDTTGTRCLPITAHGEVIGLISLHGHAREQTLSEEQLSQTVEQVALSIGNLQLRESLRQQSVRDALTGLSNRRYLEESLERELARAQRKQLPISVFMIDVDHFKHLNDRYGHEAGDTVLRKIGQLLRESTRESDIAARYGGEEFTLVLPEVDRTAALARAEALRFAVENLELGVHGALLGSVTISIGVALYPVNGPQPADLMRAADQALYAAKRNGRNRVQLADNTLPAIAA